MPTGIEFLGQYHDRLKLLLDTSVLPLTAVGGTANAVTATLDPPLTAGLVAGMKFGITWAATNTGGVTLALNGGAAVPVLDAVGAALIAGAITAGQRSLIEYVAGAFRLIGAGSAEARALPYFEQITTSRTFIKPPGFPDNARFFVELWGAGASGARYGSGFGAAGSATGGGGGAYASRMLRYADVPSSVTSLIGAGGAGRTTNGYQLAGGDTTFGSLLRAKGAPSNLPAGPVDLLGTIWSGGAGGQPSMSSPGGSAVFGGAGGGGQISTAAGPGGESLLGGNGGAGGPQSGDAGTAGSAPGGGGGGSHNAVSGAGARGEIRIWIG